MTASADMLQQDGGAYPAALQAWACAAHEPGCAWGWPMRSDAYAQAWSNRRMLCLFSRPDDVDPWLLGRSRMLHPGIAASDSELGAALKAVLEHSRSRAQALRLQPPLLPGPGDRRERRLRYLRWLMALMQRYRCRTMRSFLLRMQCCVILQSEDLIHIVPTRHQRIDGWGCLAQEAALTLRADCSNAELGAALRQGFCRCIEEYDCRRG
jgi:hypothetical protein